MDGDNWIETPVLRCMDFVDVEIAKLICLKSFEDLLIASRLSSQKMVNATARI